MRGDIILLETGDVVPADLRLITASDLHLGIPMTTAFLLAEGFESWNSRSPSDFPTISRRFS